MARREHLHRSAGRGDGEAGLHEFPGDSSPIRGQLHLSSNLVLDNEVIVRHTGLAAQPKITIEQPVGIPLWMVAAP